MKKSKILMPLTGIAAIGAVAPMVVMTSCGNKNEYNLIANPYAGTIIDKETHAFTNRLGVESFITAAGADKGKVKVDMAVELNKKFVAGHSVKVTIDGKDPVDSVFKVNPVSGQLVQATEAKAGNIYYTEWKAGEEAFIQFKEANLNKLKEKTGKEAEETFTFDAVYEEFDTDGKTSLGKQKVTYTLIACPKLSNCFVTTNENIGAIHVNNTTSGQKEGPAVLATDALISTAAQIISEAAKEGFKVSTKVTQQEFKDTGTNKFSIKDQNDLVIEEDGTTTTVGLSSTWDVGAGATAHTYNASKDVIIEFTFTSTASETKYVETTWTSTLTIAKDDATVTVAANE